MSIIGRKLSLALLGLALAAAGGCKKNPTAPEESGDRLAADGVLVAAKGGDGCQWCVCGQGATLPPWKGVKYEAVGKACVGFGVDATGDTAHVDVTNLGPRGRDGIRIAYPVPLPSVSQSIGLFAAGRLTVRDVWAAMRGRIVTTIASKPSDWVGPIYPGGWEVVVVDAPPLGCGSAVLELLHGGAVIERTPVSCETAGPAARTYLLGALQPAGDTRIDVTRGFPAPDRFAVEIGFAQPRQYLGPAGPASIDAIRLIGPTTVNVSFGGGARKSGTVITAASVAGAGPASLRVSGPAVAW